MFFFNFSFFFLFLSRLFFLGFFKNVYIVWLRLECVSLLTVFFFYKRIFFRESVASNTFNKGKIVFKYFLIQIIRRVSIFICLCSFFFFEDVFLLFFFFFLSIKLRSFPRHRWVAEVFRSLSFFEIFFLRVVPKLPAFFFVFFFFPLKFFFFFFFRVFTLIIRLFRRVNSSVLQHILAFSSIINLRWLIVAFFFRLEFFFVCFFSYALVSYILYSILKVSSGFSHVSFFDVSLSKEFFFFLRLLLFSILRLPVRLIFLFKFLILISSTNVYILFFLVVFNVLGVLLYIRFFFLSFSSKRFFILYSVDLNKNIVILRILIVWRILAPAYFFFFIFF